MLFVGLFNSCSSGEKPNHPLLPLSSGLLTRPRCTRSVTDGGNLRGKSCLDRRVHLVPASHMSHTSSATS